MDSDKHVNHETGSHCADCGPGKRNRFYRGKTMKADEFKLEQAYFINRRRLINRAVLGWGVVHGLALGGPHRMCGHEQSQEQISSQPVQIVVGPGLGMDRHGREILLVDTSTLNTTNTFLLEHTASGCCTRKIDDIVPGPYLLRIHYAEKHIGQTDLPTECGSGKPQKPFICETALFSLEPLCKPCPCVEGDCKRKCTCVCPSHSCAEHPGRNACLCQWTSDAQIEGDPEMLFEWRGAWVDPTDGIGLACVTVGRTEDKCAPVGFLSIDDDCGPRRLVKSNDLLYDLIRGCDLTHIESITWGEWHRNQQAMPWLEFIHLLNGSASSGSSGAIVTNLGIRFTGPVDAATIDADCFAFHFTFAGEDTGWYDMRTAPVRDVHITDPEGSDPPGTTREVHLCIDPEWLEEVKSRPNKFKHEGATVQIDVYGDYILDCHGQAIDANARGFSLQTGGGAPATPSGNGTPGGTFRSVFRVAQRPQSQQ